MAPGWSSSSCKGEEKRTEEEDEEEEVIGQSWRRGEAVMVRANRCKWLAGRVKRLARAGGVAVWVADANLVVHVPPELAPTHLTRTPAIVPDASSSSSSSASTASSSSARWASPGFVAPCPASPALLRLPTPRRGRCLVLAVRPAHLSHRPLFQRMLHRETPQPQPQPQPQPLASPLPHHFGAAAPLSSPRQSPSLPLPSHALLTATSSLSSWTASAVLPPSPPSSSTLSSSSAPSMPTDLLQGSASQRPICRFKAPRLDIRNLQQQQQHNNNGDGGGGNNNGNNVRAGSSSQSSSPAVSSTMACCSSASPSSSPSSSSLSLAAATSSSSSSSSSAAAAALSLAERLKKLKLPSSEKTSPTSEQPSSPSPSPSPLPLPSPEAAMASWITVIQDGKHKPKN